MFTRLRRQPRAYFQRTRNGQEQIVLERRHSHSGHREPSPTPSPDDSYEEAARDQARRLLAANYALQNDNERLQNDNQRFLRDNQALSRQLRILGNERDYLAQQSERADAQQEAITTLERRLAREKRKVREERAEKEVAIRHRAESAREVVEEMARLKESEGRWRAAVVELTREMEGWERVNTEKARRIRTLEDWLRRLGVRAVR